MADIIYVAIVIAFFALCALFVRACDHIIGPDESTSLITNDVSEEVAA